MKIKIIKLSNGHYGLKYNKGWFAYYYKTKTIATRIAKRIETAIKEKDETLKVNFFAHSEPFIHQYPNENKNKIQSVFTSY